MEKLIKSKSSTKKYILFTILLFMTEVSIALFVHDKIIRPYIGDVLVVILIYCFVKIFSKQANWKIALGTLLFAYLVEFAQYCNLVKHLGLQNSKIANIIIGNSFSWIDMLCYTVGIGIVLATTYIGGRFGKTI